MFGIPKDSLYKVGACLIICIGLAGCGQKGPLKLPQPEATHQPATLNTQD